LFPNILHAVTCVLYILSEITFRDAICYNSGVKRRTQATWENFWHFWWPAS